MYGPPAEPLTVALPEPMVDKPCSAACTVEAAALYARPEVVAPLNVRVKVPPVGVPLTVTV